MRRWPIGLAFFAVMGIVAALLPARAPADVLLFDGEGTSPGSVEAIGAVLDRNGTPYERIGSAALDAMSADELRRRRLLVVPGGNFEVMGAGLEAATTARIRAAVEGGLNYLGVCAGAFLAGDSPYNGIDLTGGVRFGFYADEARGIRRAALAITTPDGVAREHYWEDGPELSGWGRVLARYPDGTPAMVQGEHGRGRVLLLGVHPEAPESWRDGLRFVRAAAVANEDAARLFRAALEGAPLPSFP